MSTSCRHCGIVSRNACSQYTGSDLAEELRACPNLYSNQRYHELVNAGVATEVDRENDQLRARNEELEAEVARLKAQR